MALVRLFKRLRYCSCSSWSSQFPLALRQSLLVHRQHLNIEISLFQTTGFLLWWNACSVICLSYTMTQLIHRFGCLPSSLPFHLEWPGMSLPQKPQWTSWLLYFFHFYCASTVTSSVFNDKKNALVVTVEAVFPYSPNARMTKRLICKLAFQCKLY